MRHTFKAGLLCFGLVAGGLAAHADQKSDAIVERARKALSAAKTLQADVVRSAEYQGETHKITGTLKMLKPNLGEVRVNGPDGKLRQVLTSNGKEMLVVLEGEKQYLEETADPSGRLMGSFGGDPVLAFLNPAGLAAQGETKYLGKETVEKKPYDVVQQSLPNGQTVKLYFNQQGIPVGQEAKVEVAGETGLQRIWLNNVKLGAPLMAAQFAVRPPAGYAKYERPSFDAKLVPVGQQAPSFQLPTPDGREVSLENTLKGKKAVLINFWFHG